MAVFILGFAFTQGRLPEAAGLREARRLRPVVLRVAPEVHPVRHHRAGRLGARRLRRAGAAREGVLGARAPGPDDPLRPPALPARGVRLAVRRLALSLYGVLAAAGCVQRRRVGEERLARARRQRGRGRRAVHAGRRGRAASAAREGLRRRRDGRNGCRVLGRPADRHRCDDARRRLRRARDDLPDPLVQGGDPARQGRARSARRPPRRQLRRRPTATEGPSALRARARRRRGRPSP